MVPDGPGGQATPFSVESSRSAYDGALSRVRVDRVRMPDGAVVEREVVEHPDAVAVVALDGDDVVLLRQYRHPVGRELLEIPAGKLDEPGESPSDAAGRELVEETGLAPEGLEELLTFHNSAGWCDEATTVYLAPAVHAAAAPEGFAPHGEEAHMQVVRLPLSEALERARRGEITDAKTVIGLLLAAGRASPRHR